MTDAATEKGMDNVISRFFAVPGALFLRAMGRAPGVEGRTRAPGPAPVSTGVGPGDGRVPTGTGWLSIGLGRSLRR